MELTVDNGELLLSNFQIIINCKGEKKKECTKCSIDHWFLGLKQPLKTALCVTSP